MLTIAVCVKQVVDPEAPLSLFEIAPDGKNLVPPPGTPPVLSAFDENALEAALRLKDTVGAKITVLSLGNKMAKPVLKKTIAAGADELILLEDEAFGTLDSAQTARALARAIEKLGGVDLVLCGHTHVYERSYLMNGHYGLSSTFAPEMKNDGGDGRTDSHGVVG